MPGTIEKVAKLAHAQCLRDRSADISMAEPLDCHGRVQVVVIVTDHSRRAAKNSR